MRRMSVHAHAQLSLAIFLGFTLAGAGSSCSTVIPKTAGITPDAAPITATSTPAPQAAPAVAQEDPQGTVKELRTVVNQLTTRLEVMEEKLEAARTSMDALLAHQRARPTPIVAHPARGGGQPVTATPAEAAHKDLEGGFVNDDAVQTFRKGMLLLNAGRYPDALTQFSGFLEKYPDHPLAGSAQYYMGNSYFRQKEYKLALREYQRVLTSYDRSSQVAQTLREMAESEDALKRTEDAARHRQLLMSLFPHSPAALTTASAEKPKGTSPASAEETHPGSAPATSPAVAPAITPGVLPPTAPLDPVPTEVHTSTE